MPDPRDLLPQPPWKGPPVPRGITGYCSPEVINVRNNIYYHGYEGRFVLRREIYFTADKSEAMGYAEYRDAYQVLAAKISPNNPFCSIGPVTAAKGLLLWKEYKTIVSSPAFHLLQRGEGYMSGQIRRRGYDAWIRLDGKLVVVYDPQILTIIATTLLLTEEEKVKYLQEWRQWYRSSLSPEAQPSTPGER
ncbi:unnamed protein product [marine sediment metagenome]|uniref:Uncharacterized protein n=1 Tax=marine sediment metagenome TaxID=412755 RepID=X1P772_9ZZZZ